MLPSRTQKIVEVTSWVLLVVLLTIIFKTLSFLFIPLSIALLLSYALEIPLDKMRRWGLPAYLRITIVVLFVFSVIYLMGTLIRANIEALVEQLPEFQAKFDYNFSRVLNWMGIDPEEAIRFLIDFTRSFGGADFLPLGGMMQRLGGSFFAFLGNLMWVLLFMIFILAERESLTHRLVRGLGEERSGPLLRTISLINREVQLYLWYKVLISFATGVVVTFTLWLFDVPFALLWGSTAFLLNLMPYIGSILASIPPVAITLLESGLVGKTIMVAIVITMIQMTIGNLIEPLAMGRGLDLSPLLILFSLVFWGWVWGVIGMLLAIPITGAIKIAFEQIESTRYLAVLMSSR